MIHGLNFSALDTQRTPIHVDVYKLATQKEERVPAVTYTRLEHQL